MKENKDLQKQIENEKGSGNESNDSSSSSADDSSKYGKINDP